MRRVTGDGLQVDYNRVPTCPVSTATSTHGPSRISTRRPAAPLFARWCCCTPFRSARTCGSRRCAAFPPAVFAARSPLERSVLALIDPVLVPNEAEFLRKNTFQMTFHDFDWKLNDLTGR